MHISKIIVNNFRLLKDSMLDLEEQSDKNLSVMIGRNNSGKTSFLMILDKFLKNSSSFNIYDFPVSIRKNIFEINKDTDIYEISIKLIIEISYSSEDNLENLSDFILDLNPFKNKVHILFECTIDKDKLLKEIKSVESKNCNRFIKKNIIAGLLEEYAKDLKTIYTAPTEKLGYEIMEEIIAKWNDKYPNSMKSWNKNWESIIPIFKFSPDVRKVIYTTNAIESLNSSYKRLNSQRSVFPSDISLLKALYLATKTATKKWSQPIRNWWKVYGEFSIMYPNRLPD